MKSLQPVGVQNPVLALSPLPVSPSWGRSAKWQINADMMSYHPT